MVRDPFLSAGYPLGVTGPADNPSAFLDVFIKGVCVLNEGVFDSHPHPLNRATRVHIKMPQTPMQRRMW